MATVLVDGENVRRSAWPNLPRRELEQRARTWAETNGHDMIVVWEPRDESADDWIARHAHEYAPYWLVTSDRELRERAGGDAERVIGGGAFLQELSAEASE
jgi:predicted RNA-binding protein with PIN domain